MPNRRAIFRGELVASSEAQQPCYGHNKKNDQTRLEERYCWYPIQPGRVKRAQKNHNDPCWNGNDNHQTSNECHGKCGNEKESCHILSYAKSDLSARDCAKSYSIYTIYDYTQSSISWVRRYLTPNQNNQHPPNLPPIQRLKYSYLPFLKCC